MTTERSIPGVPRRREKPAVELDDEDIHLAMLAYVPVLFLVALVLRRRSAFVLFHLRQGLVLFALEILAGMIHFAPAFGWEISLVLATACFVTALRGVSKAREGIVWEAPLVNWIVTLVQP